MIKELFEKEFALGEKHFRVPDRRDQRCHNRRGFLSENQMTLVVWLVARLAVVPLPVEVNQTPLVWFAWFSRHQVECRLVLGLLQRLLVLVTVSVRLVSPMLV